MSAARRELTFLLAEPERRLLRGLAARLPPWVTPDELTGVGVLGATFSGVAYALSVQSHAWLWAASASLVVNWFGDSLDGTLARERRAERPRYGYYLDHIVDAFATVVIGAGVGLSPYVDLWAAFAAVVAYLILSINVYLESSAFGVFTLGYGRVGPTEIRLLLITANTLAVVTIPGAPSSELKVVVDAALAAITLAMLWMLAVRIARNLRTLAQLEPVEPAARAIRVAHARSRAPGLPPAVPRAVKT